MGRDNLGNCIHRFFMADHVTVLQWLNRWKEVWFSIAYIEAISYREWDSNLFKLCIRGHPECQVESIIHTGFLRSTG